MPNQKKPVISSDLHEIEHGAVSEGELTVSPSNAKVRSNANPEPGSDEPQLVDDVREISRITDRRRARRFPVCSPATIRWLGKDAVLHEAFGMVRDMSTSGLFVEAALPLRPNSNVELEIVPFGMHAEDSKTELHFEGKIVRTETASRRGFAVAGFLWLAKLGRRIT